MMSFEGDRRVKRARALIGVRFRAQGRDPLAGLDCVGAAAAAAGIPPEVVRRDYAMQGESLGSIERDLAGLGCRKIPAGERTEGGDVIVCRTAPAQHHLLIATGTGFVHADARLGLVVERPLPVPWPVRAVWRPADEEPR